MRKFKAGMMQATESLLETIALDGMSDAWRADRIEALQAFAPKADKMLDTTERATLRDAATAAAGMLHDPAIVLKLQTLARRFAADAASATVGMATTSSGDPAAECKSYGLTPGSDDYKACVAAMTEADNAGAVPDTGADQMRTDIERRRAALQKTMADQMRVAQQPSSRCVTTVTATNTATSCP